MSYECTHCGNLQRNPVLHARVYSKSKQKPSGQHSVVITAYISDGRFDAFSMESERLDYAIGCANEFCILRRAGRIQPVMYTWMLESEPNFAVPQNFLQCVVDMMQDESDMAFWHEDERICSIPVLVDLETNQAYAKPSDGASNCLSSRKEHAFNNLDESDHHFERPRQNLVISLPMAQHSIVPYSAHSRQSNDLSDLLPSAEKAYSERSALSTETFNPSCEFEQVTPKGRVKADDEYKKVPAASDLPIDSCVFSVRAENLNYSDHHFERPGQNLAISLPTSRQLNLEPYSERSAVSAERFNPPCEAEQAHFTLKGSERADDQFKKLDEAGLPTDSFDSLRSVNLNYSYSFQKDEGKMKTDKLGSLFTDTDSGDPLRTRFRFQSKEESEGSPDSLVTLPSLPSHGSDLTSQYVNYQRSVPDLSALDTSLEDSLSFPMPEMVLSFQTPMFSEQWQVSARFSSFGGTLRKQGSDVTLIVPAGAVDRDTTVDIYSAINGNVELLERFLCLIDDQYVVTPLAEYSAANMRKFQQHVCIKMKHCMPPNTSPRHVRVYSVKDRAAGFEGITRVRCKSTADQQREGIEPPTDGSSLEERRDESASCSENPSEASQAEADWSTLDKDGLAWDETAYFELSTDGYVYIFTDHFSGFVCFYCGRKQELTLHAIASGRLKRKPNRQLVADISADIWDERLKVRDFRQEYELNMDGISEPTVVELLDESKDSSCLCVRLRFSSNAQNEWQHSLDDRDQPSLPVEKRYKLRQLVKCEGKKCAKRVPKPVSKRWSVESSVGREVDAWLECVVAISHVIEGNEPNWDDQDGKERTTHIKLTVARINDDDGNNSSLGTGMQVRNPQRTCYDHRAPSSSVHHFQKTNDLSMSSSSVSIGKETIRHMSSYFTLNSPSQVPSCSTASGTGDDMPLQSDEEQDHKETTV
ncbi:hypothetical protein BaRGS_00039941 [Batillaria attramentaria]|uniref:ZU5 domain-containing protein n=1 Tax=Batillaria attramentaria TaxID=370345 RepID=A0ABD0J1Z6_9CAEN